MHGVSQDEVGLTQDVVAEPHAEGHEEEGQVVFEEVGCVDDILLVRVCEGIGLHCEVIHL